MDANRTEKRIGDLKKRESLAIVEPIEDALYDHAPLPLNYDVSRPQGWFFSEFSYTEFMGGLIVMPMSDEVAARMIQASLGHTEDTFDIEDVLKRRLQKEGTLDKYRLEAGKDVGDIEHLIILPGSNLLSKVTSRELLTKAMYEHPTAFIKPHPLTNDFDQRWLRLNFGADRLLESRASGWQYLQRAEEVWTVATSELAAYATLMKKPVHNIGNIFMDRSATYYPILRLVMDKPVEEAYTNLVKALQSNRSGIIFVQRKNWLASIRTYFELVMEMRELFRPLVYHAPTSIPGHRVIQKIPKPENVTEITAEPAPEESSDEEA